MKLFEKTNKFSYNCVGFTTRKYIVYKFLFFKISKRIHTNILISGENNRFFLKTKNNALQEIKPQNIEQLIGGGIE